MELRFKVLWAGGGGSRGGTPGTGPPLPETLESFRRNLPKELELILPRSWSEDEIVRLAHDADVILGVRVPRRVIEAAPKLKLIQTTGTGVDKIDIDAAAERGVMVCNAAGQNAVWVAEHAIALTLALAKHILKYHEDMKQGLWRRVSSIGIRDKTVGIIGMGSIGIEVAKRFRAFGAKIIGIKRHPSEELRTKLGMEFLGGASGS